MRSCSCGGCHKIRGAAVFQSGRKLMQLQMVAGGHAHGNAAAIVSEIGKIAVPQILLCALCQSLWDIFGRMVTFEGILEGRGSIFLPIGLHILDFFVNGTGGKTEINPLLFSGILVYIRRSAQRQKNREKGDL